ncbi:Transposable element tcb2 transposase [Caligus rogercresseyi]|uniref:Transposable element tcb2 transposase n=1 Tax=Caligus rogercresseyi TaxID=217165 RepID=A0A7T8KJ67_CALRO|nr:Transposable element tcb2 transposase [Caligus rogercresseyi]
MSMQVLPLIKKQEWEDSYCFQQDGAPSHTTKLVQDWCHRSFEHFWSKDMWPPSSPDLNPMDFSI